MYSTFFLGTLYLEHVLHYGALQTGPAFLPWTLTVGVLSLGVTARLVARFGVDARPRRRPAADDRRARAAATTGAHTSFFPTLFFAYFAIGLGAGTSFMPLLTIAMADVPPRDAGPRSGIINVSQQVSGALGLAVLGTMATNRTKALDAQGHALTGSLISGYHLAFDDRRRLPRGRHRRALVVLRPLERRVTESAAEELDVLPAIELERQAA